MPKKEPSTTVKKAAPRRRAVKKAAPAKKDAEKAETVTVTPKPAKRQSFIMAVGRRKSAIARVRFFATSGENQINGMAVEKYFTTAEACQAALQPLSTLKLNETAHITALVRGGGKQAQAEAVRHGLARTLVMREAGSKKELKAHGFLRRDPRVKERKKYGLKRARRAPQWSKR